MKAEAGRRRREWWCPGSDWSVRLTQDIGDLQGLVDIAAEVEPAQHPRYREPYQERQQRDHGGWKWADAEDDADCRAERDHKRQSLTHQHPELGSSRGQPGGIACQRLPVAVGCVHYSDGKRLAQPEKLGAGEYRRTFPSADSGSDSVPRSRMMWSACEDPVRSAATHSREAMRAASLTC